MAFRDIGRTSGIMNNTKRKILWVTTRVCLACFDYPTQFNSFYSSLDKNSLDQASLPVEKGFESASCRAIGWASGVTPPFL